MDKFPEAFRRFERVVDIRRIRSIRPLLLAFRWWAGENWKGSAKQMAALKVEALKRGIAVPVRRRWNPPSLEIYRIAKVTWRHEIFTVRGRPQTRFRDLKTGRFVKNPSRDISNGKEVKSSW